MEFPLRPGTGLPLVAEGAAPEAPAMLPSDQRELLMLMIFVLFRHGRIDRAGLLAEALHLTGDDGADVLLARAVMRFARQDWAATLLCLEALDRVAPLERFGSYTLTEGQRMRRYLRARCLHELDQGQPAQDAIGSYLRHGQVAGTDDGA